MIDNKSNQPKNFVLYTTPNGEVKLEVVSILEITGSKLFLFCKQFAKKIQLQNSKEIKAGIELPSTHLCETFVFFVLKPLFSFKLHP